MLETAATHDLDGARTLREASWLVRERDQRALTSSAPPIWRWRVPLRHPALELTAFVGPFVTGRTVEDAQDALIAVEHAEGVVLGVADGVTPTDATPTIDGVDGGTYAARCVMSHVGAVSSARELSEALTSANGYLFDRFRVTAGRAVDPRDRPQAAALAVYVAVSSDGRLGLSAVRAADCDLWIRQHGVWKLASPVPALKPSVRRHLDAWEAANPGASYRQRIAAERPIVYDRSQWNTTALGRFEHAVIQLLETFEPVDEVALVTDGAKLERFADGVPENPFTWLESLRPFEETRPGGHRHSDVAMLHVRNVQASMR